MSEVLNQTFQFFFRPSLTLNLSSLRQRLTAPFVFLPHLQAERQFFFDWKLSAVSLLPPVALLKSPHCSAKVSYAGNSHLLLQAGFLLKWNDYTLQLSCDHFYTRPSTFGRIKLTTHSAYFDSPVTPLLRKIPQFPLWVSNERTHRQVIKISHRFSWRSFAISHQFICAMPSYLFWSGWKMFITTWVLQHIIAVPWCFCTPFLPFLEGVHTHISYFYFYYMALETCGGFFKQNNFRYYFGRHLWSVRQLCQCPVVVRSSCFSQQCFFSDRLQYLATKCSLKVSFEWIFLQLFFYFTGTLKQTSFAASTAVEIAGAIQCVLHGVGDWDGGRQNRATTTTAEQEDDGDSLTEHLDKQV